MPNIILNKTFLTPIAINKKTDELSKIRINSSTPLTTQNAVFMFNYYINSNSAYPDGSMQFYDNNYVWMCTNYINIDDIVDFKLGL